MSTTINKEEIQKFSKLADEWWDVNGKFKPLHMFNPIRIEYITESIKNELNTNDVVLFMKGTPDFPMCGFSAATVQVLKNLGISFNSVNVLDSNDMREGIKKFSDWPTIPQLYVKKEFIGGCDIVKEMYESGELLELLNSRGIQVSPT